MARAAMLGDCEEEPFLFEARNKGVRTPVEVFERKENMMIQTMQIDTCKYRKPTPVRTREVVFFCHAPKAKEVSLVGTFNDWEPGATPMMKNSKGE